MGDVCKLLNDTSFYVETTQAKHYNFEGVNSPTRQKEDLIIRSLFCVTGGDYGVLSIPRYDTTFCFSVM